MKNSKKVVKGVMAAGIILGGGVTTAAVMPQTTYAALGDTAEVYHPEDNPGKATITISQKNTEDNPAYVSGYLGQYFKGYAHKSATGQWQYHVDGYGSKEGVYNTVVDGQVLRVYMSEGKEQGAFDITINITNDTTDNNNGSGDTTPSKGTDDSTNGSGGTTPSKGTDDSTNGSGDTTPSKGTDDSTNGSGDTTPSKGTDDSTNGSGDTTPSKGTDDSTNGSGDTTPSKGSSSSSDSTNKAEPYKADKLPKTGDENTSTLPILGSMLLMLGGLITYLKRKTIFGANK
ncbi:LPXTG cell wall anchor domain-containing protein [Bacillus sp. FSL M8-0168]|uniref:LPXTG cell wall anchor domain-containing protein n=1 Tax=Bacillus sp. FSL M8-0168 TaxID=2921614 RepID=UPI0030FDE839